jgi:hypothetical protein
MCADGMRSLAVQWMVCTRCGIIGADALSELASAGAYACGPVREGGPPLGAPLDLKAAGTDLSVRKPSAVARSTLHPWVCRRARGEAQ